MTEHPLLSSLGRDSRELQLVLATGAGCRTITTPLEQDAGDTAARGSSAIFARTGGPIAAARAVIATDDRSVQVHACHGPARQVDVLREVLVGLLAADHTLEPRDVLVMCPDIEVYAPLISAAFGLADVVEGGHPAHELRVRLADRALSQTNPLLATVARLLELADGRVTASQVLDLAAWPPVRRRFGFDDDDLEQLARWVAQSGVRWGLDAAASRRRTGCRATRRTPGGPGSTASCSASRWPTRTATGSASRCRSTTSAATMSILPVAWPSCSTGSRQRWTTSSASGASRTGSTRCPTPCRA